jgi:hypothetical protein
MNLSVNATVSVSGRKNKKSNPNPVVANSWKDIYRDCPEHEDCFDYAIEQEWHFWSCAECPFYKKTSQPLPKVLPKSPKPPDKPKPKPTPDHPPQHKTGIWHRIASMLGGQK